MRNTRSGRFAATPGVTSETTPEIPRGPSARDVSLIQESGAFDLDHYSRQLQRELSLEEAVGHYVSEGEARGLDPTPDFDVRYYLRTYPGVADAGVNAFAHYLRFGRRERRYPTAAALAKDAQVVLEAGAFDAEYYRRTYPRVDFATVRPLEHYLTFGCRRGMRPNERFDDEFYVRNYPEVADSPMLPLVYWLRVGARRGHRTCFEDVAPTVKKVRDSSLFDPHYYKSAHDLPEDDVDPALHYVLHGAQEWLDPGPAFSTEYYLRRYPDLQTAGINPLTHFDRFGRAEGRRGVPPSYRTVFVTGRAPFHYDRPNLMILLHEASRTGAPLLGLALAQEFAASHNVFVWAGSRGVLDEDLMEAACLVGHGFANPLDCEFILSDLLVDYAVDAVIANSVETSPVHAAILACDLPSVGLIHEFASYSRPIGKITDAVGRLDRCIVPAELVKASALQEIDRICGSRATNLVVRPQGHLPRSLWSSRFAVDDDDHGMRAQMQRKLSGHRVVLGAGFVHIRKGLDLFVETARRTKELSSEPVHFLWIGDGWAPSTDFTYSLWIQDSLERWGLEDDVTIIEAQNTIDWAFELADVFLLSSRLDPFPNVAVDAMAANVPVVCFDGTTGIAEFIAGTGAAGAVVPYLDVRAAAVAVIDQLGLDMGSVRNERIVEERFDFRRYARAIEAEIELAKQDVASRLRQVEALHDAACFDRSFYDVRWSRFPDDRGALKEYVARSMKGIYRTSPLPGFRDTEVARYPGPGDDVPLLRTVLENPSVPPRTHDCLIVDDRAERRPSAGLKVALHLHLFYADLAEDALAMLMDSGISADLFVSCGSELSAQQLGVQFRRYRRGTVTIRTVPNTGRDIGPFVTEFGKELLEGGYDVIGHLHGKRSTDIGTGDAWRRFLWGNLLGGPEVWSAVEHGFAADGSLGLMFSEDRNVVGWSRNKVFGEELRERLGVVRELPAVPVFPLGTMFWARPEAVRPLLESGLTWDDFPPEPLPYDGSMLHAIERLLPTICEESGYRWTTIHVPGTTW
ncbi:rhamnan synthesis F family protein [Promicromonospora panici]|uniref:rhamnan synthesis F family protein n=1 Tax=Promicromonospora panici TaxID=2219658 RepID=UPI0013E9F481|nr:rhamnan synthesis F family protein [Promicromonospora panici]